MGGYRSPLGLLAFLCMDLREMLSGNPGHMMDTYYGENRIKISCPYPEKIIVEIRYLNQFSTFFGEFLFPYHGTARSRQSNTLVFNRKHL